MNKTAPTIKHLDRLIKDFAVFLNSDQYFSSATDLHLYECDATSIFKSKAAIITIPDTSEQVSLIIKSIHKINKKYGTDFKFVARGAGTGLSGGAIGHDNCVLISLAKFDKIHQVNLEHKWAIVGAGLVNAKLTEYLKSSSMHFAPDPSSQLACTLGGNVAENAGGIHCFKYGMTVDHTLGLEYIDAEGNINYLGNLGASDEYVPSSFNFDMTGFFVGSEGTLGIATKIMVKLSENPASCFTARICFVDPLEATRLVSEIIRSGLSPAALEIIDNYAVQAVNNSFKLGLATDIKSVLIIEFDGYKDEIVSEVEDLKQIIINFQVADYGETFDPNERLKLWKVRKGAAAAFGQIAPYWYLYDFVVPRSKISAALSEVQLIAAKYKLVLANLIHAGDGNLHPNFLYDPVKEPDVLDRIHQASHEIMQVCTKLDGALSGEHGIGIEKKEFMKFMFNDEDLKMMLKARRVFDPQFLANPYKVFPNHVCGECAREIKG